MEIEFEMHSRMSLPAIGTVAGVFGMVDAKQVAEWYERYQSRLFGANIRRFLHQNVDAHPEVAESKATEAKLRQAMQRLLDGQPAITDGVLTKENLAREAGVSHATVHRATEVIAEWHIHVQSHAARPKPVTAGNNSEEPVAVLHRRLGEATAAVTALPGKLDALASVAANLYHENLALRRQLGTRGVVVALPVTQRQTRDGVP